MNIKASNGCFLTQVKEVPIEERIFTTTLTISSFEEMAEWVEIPESEKKEMEARAAFFAVKRVDMDYLYQMDNVMHKVSDKINDAHLSNEEALKMQKYFPKWEDIQGRYITASYRFECEGMLFEVVYPHTVTEDKNPCHQPMLLNLPPEDDILSPGATTSTQPPVYYKLVEVEEKEEAPADPEPAPETKPEVEPEVKPETQPEVKPEDKVETKPETDPKTEPEVPQGTEPAAKSEAGQEVKPESTPETKQETEPDTKKSDIPVK